MTPRRLALTTVAVLGLFPANNAFAESLANQSIGVKVLAGADIWTAPSNVPADRAGDAWYTLTAAGFGYGAIAFYDWRFSKFIGVELGLAYQHGTLKHVVTYPTGLRANETITTNALRAPVLLKLNVPTDFGRVWFGAGPEFTLFQVSSAKNVAEGPGGVPDLVDTTNPWPIFATAGLGVVLEIAETDFEIPIDIRASKNLMQPDDWTERVTPPPAGTGVGSVRAESSWVFRLGVGIGYRF